MNMKVLKNTVYSLLISPCDIDKIFLDPGILKQIFLKLNTKLLPVVRDRGILDKHSQFNELKAVRASKPQVGRHTITNFA